MLFVLKTTPALDRVSVQFVYYDIFVKASECIYSFSIST